MVFCGHGADEVGGGGAPYAGTATGAVSVGALVGVGLDVGAAVVVDVVLGRVTGPGFVVEDAAGTGTVGLAGSLIAGLSPHPAVTRLTPMAIEASTV